MQDIQLLYRQMYRLRPNCLVVQPGLRVSLSDGYMKVLMGFDC